MWTKPGYGPSKPAAPEERGLRIACFERGDGEQLRVTLEEYEGHRFVSLRVWARENSQWWPSKKGCSIRRKELRGMIEALQRAEADLAAQEPAQPPRDASPGTRPVRRDVEAPQRASEAYKPPEYVDRRPRRRRLEEVNIDPEQLNLKSDQPFDEF
jgi:hypothetical protein